MPLRILSVLGATPLRFEIYLHWHERTHRDPAHAAFRAAIVGKA